MTRDTVGGYRGSGEGATMRPPPPVPSAVRPRVDPTAILNPTEALEQAANLSRRAFIAVANACDRGEPEGAYYDQGLLNQATQLATCRPGPDRLRSRGGEVAGPMTAVLAERRSTPMAPRAGMPTDLWFPGQQDPTAPMGNPPDPLRYVVWVQPRPPSRELAPRVALHCNGCQL